jgi:hypothetical protein
MFINVHELEDISPRLSSLKQTGSALNYATEFKTLASTLQLNAPAKMLMFKAGLNDGVKDGLAYATDISTFDGLVSRAIKIDQTQFAKRKAARFTSSRSKQPQPQRSSNSNSTSSSSSSSRPQLT